MGRYFPASREGGGDGREGWGEVVEEGGREAEMSARAEARDSGVELSRSGGLGG